MRPKTAKNKKKVKCDGPTDRRMDGPMDGLTKKVVELLLLFVCLYVGLPVCLLAFDFYMSQLTSKYNCVQEDTKSMKRPR